MEWLDAAGTTIARTPGPTAPTGAVKARIHYRVSGASKKPVFISPDLAEQVEAFQALLGAAYVNDWAADGAGRPVPPAPLPATGRRARGETPRPDDQATLLSAETTKHARPDSACLASPTSASGERVTSGAAFLPATKRSERAVDVVTLARWYTQHVEATYKRNGGKRSPTTTGNYKNALQFLESLARYEPGDPRLELLGLQPGGPLRCDDPATGINEHDLILLLETRAATNLRDRAANERAMARWATVCDKEERLAQKERRAPVLPAPPELRHEAASARTVEAFAQVVKAMFEAAYRRKKIPYQPWTATVDDEVKHAPAVHYTTKALPDRDQVRRAATTMSEFWRLSATPEGYPVSINGARFHALVWLAGTEALRPEESIAIRDSWVVLDDGDPRIELHHAEVYHPRPGGGRIRVKVPLKHRAWGDIRVIRPEPEDREEFRRVLLGHRERFVPAGDLTSADPDRHDPRFFTTHRGEPIDLSNFSDKWWKPVAAQAFKHASEASFAEMPFRRLRAAGITGWLVRGCTTEAAAYKAGNSQAVLEKHYKGVLSARSRTGRVPAAAAPLDLTAQAFDGLNEAQLGALITAAKEAMRSRLES